MGLNLHHIVRGAINAVNSDLPCELYRMTGKQQRDEEGDTIPIFSGPASVKAQFQSLSQDMIRQYEMLEITNTTRRVYLYADKSPASRPWAQWRPLGRSGDVIKDNNGSIWTISAVIEDFTNEGWICVMATLQPTGIRMIVEPIDCTEGGKNASN